MTPANLPTPTTKRGDAPLSLRPYQQEAVDFIHNRRRAGLLLDMGLG